MDFDKILSQWEESQKKDAKKKTRQGPGKKANAPGIVEKSVDDSENTPALRGAEADRRGRGSAKEPRQVDAADYLSHWIAIHGVQDKDGMGDSAGDDRSSRVEEAERLRRMRPQAVLDLHGKTAADAEALVADFLSSSSRSGLEKVLIVHGKGLHSAADPVMAGVVRKALEGNKLAGSFGPADRNQGGKGATWVRIRKRDYFSR